MFILRAAFYLSLAALVMPSDAQQRDRLFAQAAATAHWASTFCDRNDQLCQTGREHWATLVTKTGHGAELVAALAAEWQNPGSVIPATATVAPQSAKRTDRLLPTATAGSSS